MIALKIKGRIYLIRFIDVLLAVISLLFGVILSRIGTFDDNLKLIIIGAMIQVTVISAIFPVMNIYKILWTYARSNEFLKLCIAVTFSQSVSFVLHYTIGTALFPKVETGKDYLILHILTGLIFIILSVSVRLSIHLYKRKGLKKRCAENLKAAENNNVMIIGAGEAADLLLIDIERNQNKTPYKPKCIIDDDPLKIGMIFCKTPVVGNRRTILRNVEKYNIQTIIFAIPSCPADDKNEILAICNKTGCKVKTIPSLYQYLVGSDNTVSLSSVRNIEIEDLLGRDPIKLDLDSVMQYVHGKVVMVTGGGGSIGSELCRQLSSYAPKQLIIFDIYENNAYDIQLELRRTYPNLDIVTLIGSVRDVKRLENVFDTYRPEIIYHAAAHKHVPLMEDSPLESVKNNVFGTLNTVRMADKYMAKKFVMISTDKAVNPTNIMGATKRICEMIVQSFNKFSKTEFVAVRFGNVLGSNGSVIPIFKKQIAEGGPVTVTHPDIIRYFMTIPEAVSLVLQAGATAKGGEIFVLDMGKPVKILDLAENLIRLSGFEPGKDIEIKFTGLRPGEKLYEELLMNEEGLTATENELIHIGKPIDFDETRFYSMLDNLSRCVDGDGSDIRALVHEIVPTYKNHYERPSLEVTGTAR